MKNRFLPIFIGALLFFSCNNNNDNKSNNNVVNKPVPVISYEFLGSFPHDTTSFTEGLLFHNGKLFESTGASSELPQTRSLFGIVDSVTGKIDKKAELDKEKYFGEGITFLNGKVFQLTYKNQVGFIYDATTYKRIGQFNIPSKEGWGMTTDGKSLIMSDGSYKLTYIDPATLQVTKTLSVSENGYAKEYLNELEFIEGYIFANIYTTQTIVKIDTANGNIVGKLDLTPLAFEAKNLNQGSLEMNGIAYDSTTNKIVVTGKLWPKIYEIRLNK